MAQHRCAVLTVAVAPWPSRPPAPMTAATHSTTAIRFRPSGSAVDKTKAKTPAIERSDGRRIAVVLCVAAIIGAAVLMARARPRRSGQHNDVAA